MLISKSSDDKCCCYQNNGNKLWMIWKVLIVRAIQKRTFDWIWAIVKFYGHLMWHFGFFYHAHCRQMWSCHMTQLRNFEIFYFGLILHLILGKVTKFLVEKFSHRKNYLPDLHFCLIIIFVESIFGVLWKWIPRNIYTVLTQIWPIKERLSAKNLMGGYTASAFSVRSVEVRTEKDHPPKKEEKTGH